MITTIVTIAIWLLTLLLRISYLLLFLLGPAVLRRGRSCPQYDDGASRGRPAAGGPAHRHRRLLRRALRGHGGRPHRGLRAQRPRRHELPARQEHPIPELRPLHGPGGAGLDRRLRHLPGLGDQAEDLIY